RRKRTCAGPRLCTRCPSHTKVAASADAGSRGTLRIDRTTRGSDPRASRALEATARYARRMHLSGKVALVTGSSRGIGHAIAKALLAAGADLAVHGRQDAGPSAEGAAALVEEAKRAGRRAAALLADVAVRT